MGIIDWLGQLWSGGCCNAVAYGTWWVRGCVSSGTVFCDFASVNDLEVMGRLLFGSVGREVNRRRIYGRQPQCLVAFALARWTIRTRMAIRKRLDA